MKNACFWFLLVVIPSWAWNSFGPPPIPMQSVSVYGDPITILDPSELHADVFAKVMRKIGWTASEEPNCYEQVHLLETTWSACYQIHMRVSPQVDTLENPYPWPSEAKTVGAGQLFGMYRISLEGKKSRQQAERWMTFLQYAYWQELDVRGKEPSLYTPVILPEASALWGRAALSSAWSWSYLSQKDPFIGESKAATVFFAIFDIATVIALPALVYHSDKLDAGLGSSIAIGLAVRSVSLSALFGSLFTLEAKEAKKTLNSGYRIPKTMVK